MEESWFVADVDAVDGAAETATAAISRMVAALNVARDEVLGGVPVVDALERYIIAGGKDLRGAASEAMEALERALLHLRANAIRYLVDELGFTLTDAASRLRISRQRAARMYATAPTGRPCDD